MAEPDAKPRHIVERVNANDDDDERCLGMRPGDMIQAGQARRRQERCRRHRNRVNNHRLKSLLIENYLNASGAAWPAALDSKQPGAYVIYRKFTERILLEKTTPLPQTRTKPIASAAREAQVLSKATMRAAAKLELPNRALAAVLGLSDASISRLKDGRYILSPSDKAFELALLFVRLYRGLYAITGGDEESARSWLRAENLALRGRPIDLIRTVTGLASAVEYVDSRRARI